MNLNNVYTTKTGNDATITMSVESSCADSANLKEGNFTITQTIIIGDINGHELYIDLYYDVIVEKKCDLYYAKIVTTAVKSNSEIGQELFQNHDEKTIQSTNKDKIFLEINRFLYRYDNTYLMIILCQLFIIFKDTRIENVSREYNVISFDIDKNKKCKITIPKNPKIYHFITDEIIGYEIECRKSGLLDIGSTFKWSIPIYRKGSVDIHKIADTILDY